MAVATTGLRPRTERIAGCATLDESFQAAPTRSKRRSKEQKERDGNGQGVDSDSNWQLPYSELQAQVKPHRRQPYQSRRLLNSYLGRSPPPLATRMRPLGLVSALWSCLCRRRPACCPCPPAGPPTPPLSVPLLVDAATKIAPRLRSEAFNEALALQAVNHLPGWERLLRLCRRRQRWWGWVMYGG